MTIYALCWKTYDGGYTVEGVFSSEEKAQNRKDTMEQIYKDKAPFYITEYELDE